MGGWWVEDAWTTSPAMLVSWVFWVIFSIVLHELGHGFAAIRCGDRTPIETGHMTWNPMVHMGPMSLLCFAVFGFTWGLMPVSPSRFRGPHDEAIVAGAGPAVNLGLAVICTIGALGWVTLAGIDSSFKVNVLEFWRMGMAINCMGVVFNLLPIPPLDGHYILGDFFPRVKAMYYDEQKRMFFMLAFMVLFFVAAGRIWGWVFALVDSVIGTVL